MGVPVRAEVFGMFASELPATARDQMGRWTLRKRQGMVPDIVIGTPAPDGGPPREHLYELKTPHCGSSTYTMRAATRCRAVEARAEAIPEEYHRKARTLDRTFAGTSAPTVGPVERKLQSYGPIRGLVFGHYGESSQAVATLLEIAATHGAARHWQTTGAADAHAATGVFHWLLQRRWGLTALRSNARLVLNRLEHLGSGAPQATARRQVARAAAADAHRAAYHDFTGSGRRVRWGR
jgi:hypothetical protein